MGAIIVGINTTLSFRVWHPYVFKIATGVIISWGRTVYTEFELLAGKSAPHDFLQLLIYKSATFNGHIDKIDTVRAYHVCTF